MSKGLPYFKWFPWDAEGDDFYIGLTADEGWTYHRLMNRAWMNDGIPADLDELAKILGKSRAFVDKVWPKLSRRWTVSPRNSCKLVNPRQEIEFQDATTKSENMRRPGNRNAKKTQLRSSCDPIDHIRACGCGSGSESKNEVASEEPLHLPLAQEFPETAAAIRNYFRSAPDTLVVEVAHAAVQAYVATINGAAGMPDLTDPLIAEAVHEAYFKRQDSPFAFKTTVPRVVKSWAEEELRRQTH